MCPYITYLPIFFSLSAGVKDCVLCFEHAQESMEAERHDVLYNICVCSRCFYGRYIYSRCS